MVFSYLHSKDAVTELFREVAPKIADRPGGYTRILKTRNRLGDNAEMCMMELVDFNENMLSTTEAKKTKTTRRRGGKKKTEAAAGGSETSAPETTSEAKAEAPKKSRRKKADSDDKKKEE